MPSHEDASFKGKTAGNIKMSSTQRIHQTLNSKETKFVAELLWLGILVGLAVATWPTNGQFQYPAEEIKVPAGAEMGVASYVKPDFQLPPEEFFAQNFEEVRFVPRSYTKVGIAQVEYYGRLDDGRYLSAIIQPVKRHGYFLSRWTDMKVTPTGVIFIENIDFERGLILLVLGAALLISAYVFWWPKKTCTH